MKKQLICMTAIAALMMTSATAFASTTAEITESGYNVTTDAADGAYTIKLGGDAGAEAETAKFAIGVEIEGYDTKLEAKGDPV